MPKAEMAKLVEKKEIANGMVMQKEVLPNHHGRLAATYGKNQVAGTAGLPQINVCSSDPKAGRLPLGICDPYAILGPRLTKQKHQRRVGCDQKPSASDPNKPDTNA